MKLIIDIPEQMYLNAKADILCGADILVSAIKKGTPLPNALEYLETAYTGARACDDVAEQVRLARAIAAYKHDVHEDCTVLDKVRAEIEFEVDHRTNMLCAEDVFEIIDKYKAEGDPSKNSEKCIWIKYDHRTICPRECGGENPYWRIPENMDNLKYCPYCGREIEVTDNDD